MTYSQNLSNTNEALIQILTQIVTLRIGPQKNNYEELPSRPTTRLQKTRKSDLTRTSNPYEFHTSQTMEIKSSTKLTQPTKTDYKEIILIIEPPKNSSNTNNTQRSDNQTIFSENCQK